jgi:tetratricopeptide (TPR) repeat protein
MDACGVSNVVSGSAGRVVQAQHIGSVTFVEPRVPSAIPALVPPGPSGFVNREDEMRCLRSLVDTADPAQGRPMVVAMSGMPGVGKSALMRRAAAELALSFPDGALYAAFGPDGQSPSEALARLLVALGVPESLVPSDFVRRQDLYRSLTAHSRLIVVFDDVTEAAQVIALLPSSGAVLVLVAANTALEELHADGAIPLVLEPLTPDHAIAVLRRFCPDGRVDADPEAAAALVELCGCLPLALRVAGARLAVRPRWSVARLVDELRTAEGAEGSVFDKVDQVFDAVYADFPARVRGLYRAIGVLVGGHFSAEVLASMTGLSFAAVHKILDELCLTGMVEDRSDGTFAVHRLVRGHALRRCAAEDSDAHRVDMLRRAVDWWLLGATAADVACTGRDRLRVADPARLLGDEPLGLSKPSGLAWFDREHINIITAMRSAAAQGWHERVWQLFEALFAYLDARRPLAFWLRAATLAVESAEIAGHVEAQARCRCLLAKAYQEVEDYHRAGRELARAQELAHGRGERLVASTYDFTGNLALREKRFDEALAWFQKTLEINRRLGLGRGTAMQTLHVGRALAGLGRRDKALAHFEDARRLATEVGADRVVAKAMFGAAKVLTDSGREDAADRILAEVGDRAEALGLADVLAEVAGLRAALARRRGDEPAAEEYVRAEVAAYERMGSPKAARVLAEL